MLVNLSGPKVNNKEKKLSSQHPLSDHRIFTKQAKVSANNEYK